MFYRDPKQATIARDKGGSVGDWFKQILYQGFVIGGAAALLVYLPWGWAKIILFGLLAYLLVMMGRNPLFFYRQIIRGSRWPRSWSSG